MTNTYYVPPVEPQPGPVSIDVPVEKKIAGDVPETSGTFTFVLKAEDAAYPMPEGSANGACEVTIEGAGKTQFPRLTFTKPGTYKYTVSEKNTGIEGYKYDETVYTFEITVTETSDGKLSLSKSFSGKDGAQLPIFTNQYTTPGTKLPQTGVLWWPVPAMLCLGMIFLAVGSAKKKKEEQ